MATPTPYQLTAPNGTLCLADDDQSEILFYTGYGDVATFPFPGFDAHNLRSALYDAREVGEIPNVDSVTLPDGTLFEIEP